MGPCRQPDNESRWQRRVDGSVLTLPDDEVEPPAGGQQDDQLFRTFSLYATVPPELRRRGVRWVCKIWSL